MKFNTAEVIKAKCRHLEIKTNWQRCSAELSHAHAAHNQALKDVISFIDSYVKGEQGQEFIEHLILNHGGTK